MTDSNDRQDFDQQRVGDDQSRESSGGEIGGTRRTAHPPPGSAPTPPHGNAYVVDHDQVRRETQAPRRASDRPGPTASRNFAVPPLHRPEPPSGYPYGGSHTGGQHTLNTPPGHAQEGPPAQVPYPGPPSDQSLFGGTPGNIAPAPQPSGPPAAAGYGAGAPPAGLPGRHGSHHRDDGPENDPYASVGTMRAQIHESQVAAPYKPVPQTGWRHGLWKTTRINLGLSKGEDSWNELRRRLKVNLRGTYVIAVMQSKGGVNKTTTAALIGAALATYRDEKIVAIDANPANGNLIRRVNQPSTMSWRGLNSDNNLRSYSDFHEFLGKDSTSGLEVLGSDSGRVPMTGTDLRTSWSILRQYYPIAVVDCGNQLNDDITRALLEDLPVDAIVVPSTTRLDGAQGAADTLNWLLETGYPHLVNDAVVVVSNINKIDASAQVKQLHADFERTVRSVHDVAFDPHLSDAVAIEYTRLQAKTWKCYVEAAASLADGFARASDRSSRTGPAGVPRGTGAPQQPPWRREGSGESGRGFDEGGLHGEPWAPRP